MTKINDVINGTFMFVCNNCKYTKNIDLKGTIHKSVTIKCICGSKQKHFLNHRSAVRVELTDFYGYLTLPNGNSYVAKIIDISMVGVKLLFNLIPNTLKLDDKLTIRYTLTDKHKTSVEENLEVVWIQGNIIGAQVCDAIPYTTPIKRKHFWLYSFLNTTEDLQLEIK